MLGKCGPNFWKVCKSKFENNWTKVIQVDGTVDNGFIADKFAEYFESNCTPFSAVRKEKPKIEYNQRRSSCDGSPILTSQLFDVELLSNLIDKMDNGKAAGLDELSSKHLKYCHPIVVCLLAKLFNLFISLAHIPDSFGKSYTVPIPKCDGHTRVLSVDDFSGISESPIISKVFELAI